MEGLGLRIEYIKEFSPDFEVNVKLTTVFKCAGDRYIKSAIQESVWDLDIGLPNGLTLLKDKIQGRILSSNRKLDAGGP